MSATVIHSNREAGFTQITLRFFAFLYAIGLALVIVYLWLFTQDRFITNAAFKISTQSSSVASTGVVALALPGLADSGALDSQLAIGYINSADLLLEIEKEFKLVEHYGAPTRDFVFHLPADYNLEERLEYYRKRIYAHYDTISGLTTITVDTFSPKLSQNIAETILKKSETFINVINQNIADQQLNFIRSEVERTAKQVEDANNELVTLQNQYNFITPDEAITASLTAVQALKMQYLLAEADLSSMLRDSPNSPRIESIRSHQRSLNELIDIETSKLSGPEKNRLNQLLVQFTNLKLKLDFATSLRTGAETMLDKTRSSAVAQSRFFSVIQKPYLPEDVAIPRRPYATTTILILGLLLFLILRALTSSIFERA